MLDQVWSFAEFFAGDANVSAAIRSFSRSPAIALDYTYHGEIPAMDILTPSGMAPLVRLQE